MIGKVIKYKFDNDSSLNSLFGGRVFPIVGAQGQTNPFAIYEVVNVTTAMSKDSDSHIDEMLVRITLVSTNYADVQNGIGYIRTAFVRMNETISGVVVQSCKYDGERDLFSEDERTFGSQIDLAFRVIKS
jgi:hypothetical protein